MRKISLLKNPIQDYAWGSHTAIAELLGESTPSRRPQAELWMGAHPTAPSQVFIDAAWRPLPELIERSPREVLGKRVAEEFAGKMPFLFKALAVERPLSIQAHPNLDHARDGFARENRLEIPLDAPNRNYKDQNHKPEMICALTPFWLMSGFRRIDEILFRLRGIRFSTLSEVIEPFEAKPDSEGLKRFLSAIMTMERARQRLAVKETVRFAEREAAGDPASQWILKLQAQYPGDIGVLSPLFLNVWKLERGQAMFLATGQLHGYLGGVGIELMANSDNVLRGGLTPKHIDVPELLKILDFAHRPIAILTPEKQTPEVYIYRSEADEFQLSVIDVRMGRSYESGEDRNIEIMICTSGRASVQDLGQGDMLDLRRGASILVPAAVKGYRVEGEATLYKASVP